jgi:hypothetical protein
MLADRPPAATLDHPLWGNPRETQRSVAYVSYPRRIGWGSQMPKRKRRMVRKHTVDISPCVGTALTMAVIPRGHRVRSPSPRPGFASNSGSRAKFTAIREYGTGADAEGLIGALQAGCRAAANR